MTSSKLQAIWGLLSFVLNRELISPDMDSGVSATLLLGAVPSLVPLVSGLCLQISARNLEGTLKKRGIK